VQDTAYREEQVLASNVLALDATRGRSRYWQAMRWHWTQLEGGAGIGKQCAGAGCNYREERVLASNALALDTTRGRSRYWQAMHWRWMQLQGGAGIGKQ